MTDWSMCLSPEACCQRYSAVSGRTTAHWSSRSDWKPLSKRLSPEKKQVLAVFCDSEKAYDTTWNDYDPIWCPLSCLAHIWLLVSALVYSSATPRATALAGRLNYVSDPLSQNFPPRNVSPHLYTSPSADKADELRSTAWKTRGEKASY
ncbi:hypothetical protein PoB_001340300 [Plakobranchus ocellatus]|uniref:Uncharacterized protein n=1 Tax=Plakobranchus ocellatus TaxID=259542 RepID=A0AAV3YWI4_9GAST|nr:hypothetical protein PoB_001340300 [Plakobranchus ocellatus]